MDVFLLLGVIWAAVLVPPAVQSHASRKEAFLVSLGQAQAAGVVAAETAPTPGHSRSLPVQRRRRIAGGLLVAMVATLLAGLLPTFRVLLVVHLFLTNSFIAYIALLAYAANRAGRARRPAPAPALDAPATARRRRWRDDGMRPGLVGLPELAPFVPLA